MKILLAAAALLFVTQAARAGEERLEIRSVPFEIKASGQYFVDRDLTAQRGTEGIRISANDVVLDFCGHTLSTVSVTGNAAAGINIAPLKNVTVRNGTIRGFATGVIVLGSATELNSAHVFERLRVLECRNEGFYVEAGCAGVAIRHCEVLGVGPSASGNAFALDLRCANAVVSECRIESSEVGISLLGPKCYVASNTIAAETFGVIFDKGGSGVRMNNVVIGARVPYDGGTDGGGNQ